MTDQFPADRKRGSTPTVHLPPMFNALEIIRALPSARTFEIGGLLFSRFTCPVQQEPVGIWAESDHFIHVLTARSTWKTFSGTWSAKAGETVFFRKGAYVAPPDFETNICLILFYVPDAIVRETVRELVGHLPRIETPPDARDVAIRVNHDVTLTAFIHAMMDYFSSAETPPEPLLRLKLKELVTSILVGPGNPVLAGYFRSLAACDAPPLDWIMEANFRHNLSIQQFARMCHRSLSSFKRAFHHRYGTSPGKWLLERRLDCAASLLRNSAMNVTEIMLECGFEDLSHFSRAFKEKFGGPPSTFRAEGVANLERACVADPGS